MEKNFTICCPKCGNIHLQMRAWVDANTFKFIGDCEDYEYYCQNCEEFIYLKEVCTVAEFERNNPTSNCD